MMAARGTCRRRFRHEQATGATVATARGRTGQDAGVSGDGELMRRRATRGQPNASARKAASAGSNGRGATCDGLQAERALATNETEAGEVSRKLMRRGDAPAGRLRQCAQAWRSQPVDSCEWRWAGLREKRAANVEPLQVPRKFESRRVSFARFPGDCDIRSTRETDELIAEHLQRTSIACTQQKNHRMKRCNDPCAKVSGLERRDGGR